MYKWIYEELRKIERDRARIDNRLWALTQKIRHLDEKLEKDGVDRGELVDEEQYETIRGLCHAHM